MKYVLVYDNPLRAYILGISHDTEGKARERLAECVERGLREEHLRVVPEDSDEARAIAECRHLF